MTDTIKLVLFVIEFAAWFGVFGYGMAVVVLSSVPQPDEVSEPREARVTDLLHWLLLPADWALGAGGVLVLTAGITWLLVGMMKGGLNAFPRGMRLWKENSQFRWCAKAAGICLACVIVSHWSRALLG